MPPASESELVERARRGDVGAYEEIVRMHQTSAFRLAYVLLGDAAEAEDAAQEAFVKAHRALGRFRRDAPFRPWLLQIAANEARNRRRRSERQRALAVRGATAEVRADDASSPEAQALAHESREVLRAALARLRREEYEVVACRYLLELSESETAAALTLPPGTVKSRLSRALERLRNDLEPARA
ncbi:MAG: sigma-70 family RNA polymerase sigma factor [Thermoleophilia bacterium]|nr:sigma-70 family RNA polymerase sigma factor [Thermoleophilia bacterium]